MVEQLFRDRFPCSDSVTDFLPLSMSAEYLHWDAIDLEYFCDCKAVLATDIPQQLTVSTNIDSYLIRQRMHRIVESTPCGFGLFLE